MKVVAFNGSARKDGNTAILLRRVLGELEREGIETEVVHLAGQPIHGCTGCRRCGARKDRHCARGDDAVNGFIDKMLAADGVLLGSPTYFTDVSTEMKALIDRCGFVAKANGDMFRRKVGAAVVAVRRAGSTHAFDTMNHFFTINQMIVPGSSYWNVGVGLEPGDVEKDEEGLRTMAVLGENMAWLLKRIGAGAR
ncbi:flavodoxin family protein [Anaeromyxobacter paludicola]|uniref:Flavodoxin family protein n=1 Tax=Anaeromyxobacter paludicola TaxID=2918171 RepID=A0ABN6N1V0_9BACT|nr:flavodoxin family protein [Anaeromyxobacter paludicola]BDG06901.1 flavodoxin family protein [Anaeromyxobacter paludicola]